jgi:uncharacterized protein (DUF1501 family)
MNRRIFLKNGSMAMLALGFAPGFVVNSLKAARARRKVLVTIFQRGAVDGLNMIVPYGEEWYYKTRPSIGIPKPGADGGAVDLDGFFGIHPKMAPLADLFHRNELAIVHACGSPDPTRSHFDAQDYMESGTPGVKSTQDGWLNRYLHAREHADATPFRAVSLTQQLPRSLQGTSPALAMAQVGKFGIQAGRQTDMMQSGFESQYAAAAAQMLGTTPAIGRTGTEAFDAVKMLKDVNGAGPYVPANGAEYPRSGFGDAMKQIAQLIKSDLGLEVAFAELGGWDTHVQQGNSNGQLANRLDDFARGLAAFYTDMGEGMADVVVVTMSEFGRAVNENGNRGTDHGHANAMMIMGGPVKGGKVYGKWPGLAPERRYENRDLAVTTDFREVFTELVTRHLGATDTATIFPGFTPTAPLRILG